MGGISGWWGRIGLQWKLQIAIQGTLICILIAAQQWMSAKFEHQVLSAAEVRAQAIADGAINGLNTLMLTKAGEDDVISNKVSRALFIQKMGASENIKSLRVIRGKGTIDEFGAGLPEEQATDELDRKVLASGKTEIERIDDGGKSWLRTVVPFVATKNFRTTNCLKCHGVEEGTVLGATSLLVSINDDLATIRTINTSIWIGQVILQVFLFFVIGQIVRRLLSQLGGEPSYVIDIAQGIAKGDLSRDISINSGSNHSLLAAMKEMQAGLKEIIEGILQSAEVLAQNSKRLTHSSHQVLTASERQNDASASMAASMEQMTVSINHISENASDAQMHASETGALAKTGSKAVRDVIEEMDKIAKTVTTSSEVITSLGEHSRQISTIVNTIKEIADQTNLLALNAAIEAARAGEQGRGFAVVADEVRKLAERTSTSTQEIAAMIHSIQSGTSDAVDGMSKGQACVTEGVAIVGNAGNAMEEIQRGVQNVLASVGDISSSLKEQSAASNLISSSIESIAAMTDQTSSTIREVASSADKLAEFATRLKESVGRFRL